MRVEFHVTDIHSAHIVKSYAESRVWLAVGQAARRPTWVGVSLRTFDAEGPSAQTLCRIDAWLGGVGLVTVSRIDSKPRVAIDGAAARLTAAIRRRLHDASSATVKHRPWGHGEHAVRGSASFGDPGTRTSPHPAEDADHGLPNVSGKTTAEVWRRPPVRGLPRFRMATGVLAGWRRE